jgi:YHYH protein
MQKIKKIGTVFSIACLCITTIVACGGGGSAATSAAASSASLATNCQTMPVTLSGGLPPGMTAMAALGANYITSVTAGTSNVVVVTKDRPNHASPYCPTGVSAIAGCANESVTLSSPSFYSGGTFALNPNVVSSTLRYTLTIPLQPTCAAVSTDTSLDAIGTASNGIAFFNQYAAGNAVLTNEINGFDRFGGHPAGQGNYHYHMEPRYLTNSAMGNASASPSALIGWALDGFPVYGTTNSSGTPLSLDSCHGEFHATTEYPSGIYHYHVTSSAPYLVGCYAGTPGTKVLTP